MSVDASFTALLADRRNELRRPPPGVAVADVRSAFASFMRTSTGPEIKRIDTLTIDGCQVSRLPVRLYRPSLQPELPAVVFCHGGGFVLGDLDTHDALCRGLAHSSGCVVVAVDYRRAPEYPFPIAIDDCLMVLDWIRREAGALGVHVARIAVAGDSAGAHVAIGAALSARDRGIELRHAALLYPVIDPTCSSRSMGQYANGYLLTREAMQWFWECYLPPTAAVADPRARLLTADLRGFPPTTVLTAEFDPLCDEGEAFAARLRAASVPVELCRMAGAVHGFAGLPQVTPLAAKAVDFIGGALRRSLTNFGQST